jgi:hypothetical protein
MHRNTILPLYSIYKLLQLHLRGAVVTMLTMAYCHPKIYVFVESDSQLPNNIGSMLLGTKNWLGYKKSSGRVQQHCPCHPVIQSRWPKDSGRCCIVLSKRLVSPLIMRELITLIVQSTAMMSDRLVGDKACPNFMR